MANITLSANSDWSTCNGGGAPGASDNIYLNGYDLTLDTTPCTCNEIRATQSDGTTMTAGKIIVAADTTVVINADLYAGTETLLTIDDGQDVTCTGDTTGGSTSNKYGVAIESTAIFRGDVYGRSDGSNAGRGAYVNDGGLLIGDCYGGDNANGCNARQGGTVNGNGTAGDGGHGINAIRGARVNGHGTGGSVAIYYGINLSSGSIHHGDATGGTISGSHGVNANGDRTIVNCGTATGNTSGAYGVKADAPAIVIIETESGSYAKDLASGVETDNTNAPFIGAGGGGSTVIVVEDD